MRHCKFSNVSNLVPKKKYRLQTANVATRHSGDDQLPPAKLGKAAPLSSQEEIKHQVFWGLVTLASLPCSNFCAAGSKARAVYIGNTLAILFNIDLYITRYL